MHLYVFIKAVAILLRPQCVMEKSENGVHNLNGDDNIGYQ